MDNMTDRTTEKLLNDAEEVSALFKETEQEYGTADSDMVDSGEWYNLAYKQNEQITELSAKLREREWQPIETAPKDGTLILCGALGSDVLAGGVWEDKYKGWFTTFGGDIYPTHWKHTELPTPPKKEQLSEEIIAEERDKWI